MSDPSTVLRDALALPEAARTELTLRLLDSLETAVPSGAMDEAAWLAEITRRAEMAAAGESQSKPWREVYDRLRLRLASPPD